MERLTQRDNSGRAMFSGDGSPVENFNKIPAIIDRLAAYEDSGLEPEAIKNWMLTQDLIDSGITPAIIGTPLKHLFGLAKAESEGRMIVLPCKVGDTVYRHIYDEYGIAPIDKGTVYAVSINEQTNWFSVRYKSGLRYDHTWEDLGKTVFRTYEEAEAALKQEVESDD